MIGAAQTNAQHATQINVKVKSQKPARFRCWYFFAFAIVAY